MKPVGRLRSLLFAPAVRLDFLSKLPERGADAVVIDCEDATPSGAKAEGRANARRLGPELAASCHVTVRINPIATEWFADDVGDGLTPELAAVIVPKIETVDGLTQVAAALDAAGLTELGIIAGIETALGVADARPLLAHPRVIAAYFGAEDFIADMGGVRTSSNDEVAYARGAVALAGRVAGIPVLDQVVTDFRDDERFTREAAEARAMGYAGKLCIHPGQVELANTAFTPSPAEIDRARRLLAAYETASAAGVAAIDFEGQMVDEPLAAQARRVITLADDE
jgi:citrate lyase subunit beta / citryl-CoA lyase